MSSNDARRENVDRNFIVHVFRVENSLKSVLNHTVSKYIYFNVSNAHLEKWVDDLYAIRAFPV